MARGRMINNSICQDKKVDDLSDDTSRLAFTWLITFADREGRTPGDPGVVRSMLFPRRADVTIEQMACYLSEWADHGLIVWYEADGDQWVWFPAFSRNQVGLDRRHEPASRVPTPEGATEVVRTSSVQCTAEKKRNEKKRSTCTYNVGTAERQDNGTAAATSLSPVQVNAGTETATIVTPLAAYLENFRQANPQQKRDIAKMEAECGQDCALAAIEWGARKGQHDTGAIWECARKMQRDGVGKKPTPLRADPGTGPQLGLHPDKGVL